MQNNLRYFSHELVSQGRYAKAAAHSRRVRFFRKALPVLAICALIAFIALSYVRTIVPEEVVIESAGIENGNIVMNSPVLAGQNADNLPYRMKALRAIQKIGDMSVITLEEIEADLPISAEDSAEVYAQEGVFDQEANFLKFTKPLNIKTSSGLTAQFKAAEYDIGSSAFKSDQAVDIKFDGGTLSSDAMAVQNGGKIMSFTGNVQLVVSPEKLREGAQ